MFKNRIIQVIFALFVVLWGQHTFAIDITTDVKNDPYYQMNSSNLNTMNSYIIPAKNDIEPTNYEEIKYDVVKDPSHLGGYAFLKSTSAGYKAFHVMSSYVGYAMMWLIFGIIRYFGVYRKESSFGQVLAMMFEGVRGLFEEILGKNSKHWMKEYVVFLFFIVLISNLFGLATDVIRFFAPQTLRRVTAPTAEFETTLILAIIATIIPLIIQFRTLGARVFMHEYIPITGKGLIEGKGIGTKIGDVVISMFVGLLDIVGIFSKIISLSMRLFGNMSSGSILLNVVFIGLGGIFVGLINTNLVLFLPIILYIQGLLVAVVQAFVFAMLVSIGIKLVIE